MRIGFLGKGGSGKTTIAGAFTRYAAKKKDNVLAVDADVNVHLQEVLPVEEKPPKLGQMHEEVTEALEPETDRTIVHTSPPNQESNFVRPEPDNEFIDEFATTESGISFLRVGSFEHQDIGKTCYHGKLEALEVFMHRLLDSEEDVVVGDMTAGIDNLGNSLAFVYDLNVYVVEPTEKSVQVFKDFEKKSDKLGLKTKVIANKIETEEDREFIKDRISEEKILGFVERSRQIRRFEQGTESFESFVEENSEVFETVFRELMDTDKDWGSYMQKLQFSHEAMGEAWWNDFLGEEISEQVETDFSYTEVV